MRTLKRWIALRGPAIATALDSSREPICDAVALTLATAFPALCYDPARSDALDFQQRTYHETPRRFHRLLQVLLIFQAPEVDRARISLGLVDPPALWRRALPYALAGALLLRRRPRVHPARR